MEKHLLGEPLLQYHPRGRKQIPCPLPGDVKPGSKPVLAPSPTQFVLYTSCKTYHYSPTGDPISWINGTDMKQIDYAFIEERPDRNLNSDPNNSIEGYIIYEVPASFDPSQAYVDLNLMGVKTVDWQFT